jgi:hypothetical protein
MNRDERIYIPPPRMRKRRGDRWILVLLGVGALLWICVRLARR